MSDLNGAQRYHRGDRICAKSPWQEKWRIGVVTDVFVAPVTGKIVYVVNGEGFYSDEVTAFEQELADVPEPQSLRA